jgi:cellulase
MRSSTLALGACLSYTSTVLAHSRVLNFVIEGGSYAGYNPRDPSSNAAVLAAWSTEVLDDGWVGVGNYTNPNIICHLNAKNAKGYATVKQGGRIGFQWNGWPESHHGPVLTYLARCGDDPASCVEVDKRDLEFYKIGTAGLLDPSKPATDMSEAMGTWATDLLIAKNNTFTIEVPEATAPGYYVLRHELIALHYATVPGMGPQHYPQCFNVEVVAGDANKRRSHHWDRRQAEDEVPPGTDYAKLYSAEDPGLVYDIFQSKLPSYTAPGPTLVSGAVGMVTQPATAIDVDSSVSAVPAEETGRL